MIGGIAYTITPKQSGSIPALISASLTILFFIAMLTFREQGGWNVGLLSCFSAGLGVTFALLSGGSPLPISYKPVWIVLLCLVIGASGGRWVGTRLGEFGVILWLVSWAYLLGWAALLLLRLDPVFNLTWSVVGLVLFTGLSGVWFANMGNRLKHRSSVSMAIDLYLICINLFIAAMILRSTQI